MYTYSSVFILYLFEKKNIYKSVVNIHNIHAYLYVKNMNTRRRKKKNSKRA